MVLEQAFEVKQIRARRYDAPVEEKRIRLRCTACGNLTRFDVVETRRTRSFFHYTLGGDLSVEEEEILERSRERVTCRWCGSSDIDELPVEAP